MDILLNEGYTIYPLNPLAVSRYRDRYTASRAKSDSFDAELIAQALRTDRHRFRPLKPDSDLVRELRILVQDQRRFIQTKAMFLNQLHSCLMKYYLVSMELFENLDSSLALDYLKTFPRPMRVTAKRIEKFLRKHHRPYPDEKSKGMAKLISEFQLPVDEFTVRARSRSMLALVEQIKSLRDQIQGYQDEIDKLFEQHPDAAVFKSLPGAGEINGPRLMIEIGDNRERYSGPNSLQCEAGTSPVTKASGHMRIITMRRACRKTFRDTVHQYAFCTLRLTPWAKAFYDQQRAKGKNHSVALRALGDKWLKIIYHLWKEQIPYDENVYLADRMRGQLGLSSSVILQRN